VWEGTEVYLQVTRDRLFCGPGRHDFAHGIRMLLVVQLVVDKATRLHVSTRVQVAAVAQR
jgi:hypothetical protein